MCGASLFQAITAIRRFQAVSGSVSQWGTATRFLKMPQFFVELFDQVSRDLGYGELTPLDPGDRGAADISFVASIVDALSGLGPVGDGAHSPKEELDLRSIEAAAARAAVLMYRMTR